MRFLPTSMAMIAAPSISRSLISSAAARRIAQPLGPGRGRPGRLGGAGGRDGLVDVGRRSRSRRSPGGCSNRSASGPRRRPSPSTPGAADEVLVVPAQPRLDPGDRLLEARVELLVVGLERGVRDLDARLGVGGHVLGSLVAGVALVARWGSVAVSLARRRPRPATRRWHRAGDRRARGPRPRHRPVRACR